MFKITGTIFKHLFKKPATKRYPLEKPQYYGRTRGHIEIDIDACIFCGMCERRCPANAIKVSRADTQWSIERMRCVQCNSCVEVCPKKCLTMASTYTPPGKQAVKDVFTRARAAAGTENNQ